MSENVMLLSTQVNVIDAFRNALIIRRRNDCGNAVILLSPTTIRMDLIFLQYTNCVKCLIVKRQTYIEIHSNLKGLHKQIHQCSFAHVSTEYFHYGKFILLKTSEVLIDICLKRTECKIR